MSLFENRFANERYYYCNDENGVTEWLKDTAGNFSAASVDP